MFCTITYDRGDRPQYLDFCRHQLSRMTVKPDKSYFIDYPPVSKEIDLVPRVQAGIRQAQADGFEEIFFIESDDYYPSNYFEIMKLNGNDFVGSLTTWYYHIKDKRYQIINHNGRSSLFTTGLNIRALNDFHWPAQNAIGLDIALWRHASRYKRRFVVPGAVGIKHGTGMCAGSGHWKTLKTPDGDMKWLKDHVDKEAFAFYRVMS